MREIDIIEKIQGSISSTKNKLAEWESGGKWYVARWPFPPTLLFLEETKGDDQIASHKNNYTKLICVELLHSQQIGRENASFCYCPNQLDPVSVRTDSTMG